MKIGILSDAHGNWEAFQACIQDMGNVDFYLYGGDTLGYYFQPGPIIDFLMTHETKCILGNHDVAFLENRNFGEKYGPSFEMARKNLTTNQINWLSSLPISLKFDSISLFHGSPFKHDEYVYPNSPIDKIAGYDSSIIVMGHTHIPFIKEFNNKLIINPGSCGQPRDKDKRASYAILENGRCEIHRVVYNNASLIEQCNLYHPGNELLKRYL